MSDKDYTVGYGKPPLHSQFSKGLSGNPSGARKRQATATEELDRILAEKVSVTEGGKSRKITRREALLRQGVNRACSGDKHWGRILFDYLQRQQDEPSTADTSQTDQFLLAELQQMLRGDDVEEETL